MAAALPREMVVAALVAVAFLAAVVLAAVRFAPAQRGEPLRPFLVVAACLLTGACAGVAVYLVTGAASFPPYLIAFLGCVLTAVVVAAVIALRR